MRHIAQSTGLPTAHSNRMHRCLNAKTCFRSSSIQLVYRRDAVIAAANRSGHVAAQEDQHAVRVQCQRPLLTAAALATTALLGLCSPATSYAAFATQTAPADQEYQYEQASQSEDIEDPVERDVSAQLMSFIAKYDTLSPSQLVAQRQELGFKRSTDGRVFLLAKGGEQFAVKPDMQVPGLLLLQDQEGYCFYIPPDGEGQLAQIDLSDDIVVAQLFGNGVWQELLEPLDAQAEDGSVQQLKMSPGEFRGVVSLLEGALEGEEEELPE